MELTSPTKTILQYTRIQIPPHMMNSDIEDNMNIVLQHIHSINSRGASVCNNRK